MRLIEAKGCIYTNLSQVMAISTDYRDSRKAAYQQYAVVSDFNACRIPPNISVTEAAPLGVAFVAAAVALGICLGVDFVSTGGWPRGPDLLRTVRSLPREGLPQDIRAECFDSIRQDERPQPGDWIAIWGGKRTTLRLRVSLTEQDLPPLDGARCSWQNLPDSKSLPSLTSPEVVSVCYSMVQISW